VISGLLRSCHPFPSAVVTAAAVVLAVAAGDPPGTCVVLGFAVLTGQLTVGWSNDRIDVRRDRRVGHEGKPLAAGEVALPAVDAALLVAVAATTALSLLLGWRPGLLHLAALAGAWVYNAWLKATWLSWLPYAFAFGALPAVATLALPAPVWPAGWIIAAGALVGTTANLLNALPRLAAHPLSDVAGLPDRLGGRPSLLVAAALLLCVAALVTWFPPGAPRPGTIAGGGCAAVLTVAGVPLYWHRAHTRRPFFGMLAVAAVEMLAVVFTAHPLH
jgi:4-hydroxybenzoate polyprenyltransferase